MNSVSAFDAGSDLLFLNLVKAKEKPSDCKNEICSDAASCNTSECSFEMEPQDGYKGLRSIDELFAAPPTIHDYDNDVEHDTKDLLNEKKFLESGHLNDKSPSKLEACFADCNSEKQSSLCWSCQKEKPIYKCPRCLLKTCSLTCSKYHKSKLNCNGERDKTEFIRKENFTEANFISDYRFLEEINRCVLKRDHLPRPYFKSKSMRLLSNRAYHMKIHLKLLPVTFERRKINSTYYCFKNRGFLWHVEWIFINSNVTIHDRRLPDTTSLHEAVSRFIKPSTNNELYDPRLDDYNKSDDLYFYMKKERTPANETLYYKLDCKENLRSNLKDKTIVEYPIIIVALHNRRRKFELSLCE